MTYSTQAIWIQQLLTIPNLIVHHPLKNEKKFFGTPHFFTFLGRGTQCVNRGTELFNQKRQSD